MTKDKDKHFNALHNDYFNDLFGELLPNIEISSACSTHRPDASTRTYRGVPVIDQSLLRNSVFEYTGEKKFIHFTSVEALISILNTKNLRLYDLNSMEDPQEMIFASKILKIDKPDKDLITDLKSQYFAISLCSYDKKLIDDDLLMWKLYGRKGKGICLVLRIDNDRSYSGFVLGKMQYNQNKLSKIESPPKSTFSARTYVKNHHIAG